MRGKGSLNKHTIVSTKERRADKTTDSHTETSITAILRIKRLVKTSKDNSFRRLPNKRSKLSIVS